MSGITKITAVAGAEAIDADTFEAAIDALVAELELPGGFAPEVLADAQRSAASPHLPQTDWSEVPFVTIDPEGSMDLDQALHLERHGDGYRLRYAIADVAAFVRPGSATDEETHQRGATLYAPHRRIPLHPPVLSEDAASLLPGKLRPAYVWVLEIGPDGELGEVDLVRAMVRSVSRHTYLDVQAGLDAGEVPEPFALLGEVGTALENAEERRGGMSLGIPDQEVEPGVGGYRLRYRPPSRVEDWNAQLSLATGMAAARIMLEANVGLLRTMPPPERRRVRRFGLQTRALNQPWARDVALGDYLRGLDRDDPRQLALIHESATMFRGATYTPFLGDPPDEPEQAAVAAPYAHVTAPLRRLVDRFGLALCEAVRRGEEVPGWVAEELETLPTIMQRSAQVASRLEREVVDLAEAILLADRVGETFQAVVVDDTDFRGDADSMVQLLDPAVVAPVSGEPDLGTALEVRLDKVDVVTREVMFSPVTQDYPRASESGRRAPRGTHDATGQDGAGS